MLSRFLLVVVVCLSRLGCGEEEGIPDFYALKCSACVSIVAELERNLETEKPRMNVDLRKSLTSGRDKGKIVDYSVSELRTLELLEELCKGMEHYGVTRQEDGLASFQRHSVGGGSVHITGTMKIGTKKYHDDRVKLRTYCDQVVEDHEELLSEAVKRAGVAQLQKKREEQRVAELRRKGLGDDDTDPLEILGLEAGASQEDIKNAYRTLSRELHPDKTGGDPKRLERFVAVAQAYEKATGAKHEPYEDLYRQICVDIVQVCDNERQVDYVKSYFPKYYNSQRFQRPDDDPHNKLPSGSEEEAPSKKKKKKKKKKPRTKATTEKKGEEDL